MLALVCSYSRSRVGDYLVTVESPGFSNVKSLFYTSQLMSALWGDVESHSEV